MKNILKNLKTIFCTFLTCMIGTILFACTLNGELKFDKNTISSTTIATKDGNLSTKILETTKAMETTKIIEQNEKKEEKIMGKPKVEISIKDYGKIQLELEPEIAPITVENFLTLVKSNFYDGLTFHRIIDGFMMQGGDPEGTGAGGSKNNIKGEFAINGVDNPISHVRGVISMARRGDNNDSASSQFFIVHQDSPFLDGKYAAFGKVISGIDVVDKVCQNAKVTDKNGRVEEGYKPVIEYIKIIN